MRTPSLEATLPLEGEHKVRPYTGIKIARATVNTVQNDKFSSAYQTVFSTAACKNVDAQQFFVGALLAAPFARQ